jgi:hypothetical protein
MAYVDEDGSSGTGDDVNMLEGHKRQAGVPASGGRRRSRKATGDAIVDAMMQIAAASKMRASAIMNNQDKFSISKCINGLDEMQGVDERIYFLLWICLRITLMPVGFSSLSRVKKDCHGCRANSAFPPV